MKFLIPALIGGGVAFMVNRALIDATREASTVDEAETRINQLMAYGVFTGVFAGIGMLAVFRTATR